jgi:hypothetical protein
MGLALHNFHDVKGFFSPHANGCNFLNADGSARLIAHGTGACPRLHPPNHKLRKAVTALAIGRGLARVPCSAGTGEQVPVPGCTTALAIGRGLARVPCSAGTGEQVPVPGCTRLQEKTGEQVPVPGCTRLQEKAGKQGLPHADRWIIGPGPLSAVESGQGGNPVDRELRDHLRPLPPFDLL